MKILVADDHDIFRRGLRALLADHPGWEICAEASNGLEAVDKALNLKPDLAVLDVTMPGLNGLEVTRKVVAALPECNVIIVSQHEASLLEAPALQAGAKAYLTKSDAGLKLVEAIERLVSRSE